MRTKRYISILLSVLLFLTPIVNIGYGEGEDSKKITFELYDGKTNTLIQETVTFAVYKTETYEEIEFTVDLNPEYVATAALEVGQTYDIKASLSDYYMTNERFKADTDGDRWGVPLYKKTDVVNVTNSAIKVDVREHGSSGVDVSVNQEELPTDLKIDFLRVVAIPEDNYNIDEKGLPAGFNSNPQESLENTRSENLAPGIYTIFVGFFENVTRGEGEGTHKDFVLVGYGTKVVTVTETSGDPGDPPGPGPGPDPNAEADENFKFYYENFTEPFLTTKKIFSNIKVTFPEDKDYVTIKMEVMPGEDGLNDYGDWQVLEYVVERSDYIDRNISKPGVVTLRKGFGKTTLHYIYDLDEGEDIHDAKHAFITFYEEDFMGIDVDPPFKTGDWGTGIIDVSGRIPLTPISFIYFLNNEVTIRPSNLGKEFEITSIEGAVANKDGEEWNVELPDIMEPVTKLKLTLKLEDDSTKESELEIRRVLLDAFSMEYDEDHKKEIAEIIESGGKLSTPRGTPYEYNNEDSIAFIGVFALDRLEDNGEVIQEGFFIDHTLLVMYYQDDRILGTKQFSVNINGEDRVDRDPYRDEIPVFRKGHADYASVANANRITAFLISKDGVNNSSTAFGGATFGIGAGWGHLLPNHKDYGTGKDGMDYE